MPCLSTSMFLRNSSSRALNRMTPSLREFCSSRIDWRRKVRMTVKTRMSP